MREYAAQLLVHGIGPVEQGCFPTLRLDAVRVHRQGNRHLRRRLFDGLQHFQLPRRKPLEPVNPYVSALQKGIRRNFPCQYGHRIVGAAEPFF